MKADDGVESFNRRTEFGGGAILDQIPELFDDVQSGL
jgi:hypothetical protein